MPGKFITLEGIEGCGKTTQIKRLAAFLGENGIPFITTKQPGGTSIGQQIRKILLDPTHTHMAPVCESLLYFADRAQHHKEVIQPTLAQGLWVICDRYHDSTVAYQGAARGLEPSFLNAMFQQTTGSLQPDLTVLLDLDPHIGLKRARHRNTDLSLENESRFEKEELQFHVSIRNAFLDLAQQGARWQVVDASGTEDAIAQTIQHQIQTRFDQHLQG